MTSAISQSSVGTVIEDLVSNRSIPLKICMIVLNCAQLISCWIAVGYFIKTYEVWSLLELTLSIVLLIVGNYLIPGIANGIIYCRRWRRSSVANRAQMSEENKQAWVCLRIALCLLGLPTVGRYIETIIVSKKLNNLEKKNVNESVASHKEGNQMNPVGTSRLGGSTINQLKANNGPRANSQISGMSHGSSMNAIPENCQKKVRKARRQYRRCEHDGALMALISGSVGAGPMAIGLGLLYFNRDEKFAMQIDQTVVVFVSFALNLLWLAATLTHFYPARTVLSEAEFERGVSSSNFGALLLLYSSHIVQVTLRVICFSVFANWFNYYVLIPIIFHWLLGTFILVGYRAYMKSKSVGRPLGERVRNATSSFLSAMFFGYVGIFDFVNGNEGKTRMRYLIYYTFYYLENVIMLVVWIVRTPSSQIRYPIPFVASVLALFWLGFILFQWYLFKFSYSPYGTSIIGICKKNKKKNRKENYAEVVREPVFGVPVTHNAVPFWKENQQQDRNVPDSAFSGTGGSRPPKGKVTRPVPMDHGEDPSILSSKSQKDTPSIYSQPGSQTTFIPLGRPKTAVKMPPVQRKKEQSEQKKPYSRMPLSSESSSSTSSGEELPVFSAKPIHAAHSQPDLSAVPEVSVEPRPGARKPLEVAADRRRDQRPTSRPTSNSRSMENLVSVPVVAVEPHKSTKRIGASGGGSHSGNVRTPVRPLPTQDQIKQLHGKKEPRSTERPRRQ